MLNIAKKLQKRINSTPNDTAYLRVQAVLTVQSVIDEGVSLRKAIKQNDKKLPSPKDLGLYKEICFGTVRWYTQLEAIINHLLHKPLEKKNRDIHFLLSIGLYQIIHLKLPNHAAVNETVSASKLLNKPWASKLVNKILRTYLRKQDEINRCLENNDEALYAHPSWLLNKIKSDWPDHWQSIITENNRRPPYSLRINQQKTSAEGYAALLGKEKISARLNPDYPNAVIIQESLPTNNLPGFDHGLCSVQDLAGQKVVEFLNLDDNHAVLDACAAPGSKTCHILESTKAIKKLVAIDIDAERLLRIRQNMQRLTLPENILKLVLEDATHTKQWWDGIEFDRILLDAPCSATGVIRRHPDIKWLKKEADIIAQQQLQLQLLKTLWPLLVKKGQLLYTTCSILHEENDSVISKFLSDHSDAKIIKLNFEPGHKSRHGIQLLPTQGGSDGFYYSLIKKI